MKYMLCKILHKGNTHRVAKLFIGLCIGNRNEEAIGISHKSCTLPRSEAARILGTLREQNLTSILVITCGKGPGNAVKVHKTESESVAFLFVFACIFLKVVPEFVG